MIPDRETPSRDAVIAARKEKRAAKKSQKKSDVKPVIVFSDEVSQEECQKVFQEGKSILADISAMHDLDALLGQQDQNSSSLIDPSNSRTFSESQMEMLREAEQATLGRKSKKRKVKQDDAIHERAMLSALESLTGLSDESS